MSDADYQQDVEKAVLFLRGKSKALITTLNEQMQQQAEALNYEQAGLLRDQIEKLQHIQQQQHVMRHSGTFDVVVIKEALQQIGITLLTINEGKLLGSKHFYSKRNTFSLPENLAAFLTQHYLAVKNLPKQILVNIEPNDKTWLSSALSEVCEHNVTILQPQRGEKKRWLELAYRNLEQGLATYLQENLSQAKRLQALQEILGISTDIECVECFDISHTQGKATVASCVVFDQQGPVKAEYRRFNIKDITPGDDYAALRQAISRRYSRLQEKQKKMPNIVVIDGGKGQLKQAIEVFSVTGD